MSTSGSGTIFGDVCPLSISPAQLRSLLPVSESLAVLDASWHMPGSPRNALAEWRALRISGAQFLDLDTVASPHELGLKHMMPSPEVFAEACENLGISCDSHVVIYDSHGVFSSPRALFMFRAFGHKRSSILDGGLPSWIAHGCPTETGQPKPPSKGNYPVPKLDENIVKSYEQIVSNSQFNPQHEPLTDIVLDARSRDRYLGTASEPRPGLSSGHIPHSLSLPFNSFLESHPMPSPPPTSALPLRVGSPIPNLGAHPPHGVDPATLTKEADTPDSAKTDAEKTSSSFSVPLPSTYTTLKPTTQISSVLQNALGPQFADEVLNGRRGVIASCGSGMTAGVLWLGLQTLGAENVAIYDESWTGYAMRKSKIVKGESNPV